MAIDIMYYGPGLWAPTSKPWRVMDGTKCTNVLSTHLVHITGCANITPLVTSHGDTLIVWWVLRKGNHLYSKLSATTTIPRSLQDPFKFLSNSWFEILPLQHKSKLVMLLLVLYHKWWSGIKKNLVPRSLSDWYDPWWYQSHTNQAPSMIHTKQISNALIYTLDLYQCIPKSVKPVSNPLPFYTSKFHKWTQPKDPGWDAPKPIPDQHWFILPPQPQLWTALHIT